MVRAAMTPATIAKDVYRAVVGSESIWVTLRDALDLNALPEGTNIIGRTRGIPVRGPVEALLTDIAFNDVTTFYTSANVSCADARKFTLYLDVQSNNTPTNIQFLPQFSIDGGVTWFSLTQWQFVSLVYEDTDTAAPGRLNECFTGDCAGRGLFRLRVEATGTDAANNFLASAWAEFWS